MNLVLGVDADKNPDPAAKDQNRPLGWDWSYQVTQPRIADLYSKAVSEQWTVAETLDWDKTIDPGRPLIEPYRSMPVSPDLYRRLSAAQQERLMAGLTTVTFSQLLHGEQGALMVSAGLVQAVPYFDMKQAAAIQTADEARHLDVFSRYLQRIGNIYPPSPPLRRVLDVIGRHPLWQAQMVGMQIVIEGLALATFLDVRESAACPLLRSILELVIKDEARHVAFGKIGLRHHLEALNDDERASLSAFTTDLITAFRGWGTHPEDLLNYSQVLIEAGIDPTDMLASVQREIAEGRPLDLSRGMRYAFVGVILPNLEQLGLIGPQEAAAVRATFPTANDDLATLETMRRGLEG